MSGKELAKVAKTSKLLIRQLDAYKVFERPLEDTRVQDVAEEALEF
jgi:hypothetical protein